MNYFFLYIHKIDWIWFVVVLSLLINDNNVNEVRSNIIIIIIIHKCVFLFIARHKIYDKKQQRIIWAIFDQFRSFFLQYDSLIAERKNAKVSAPMHRIQYIVDAHVNYYVLCVRNNGRATCAIPQCASPFLSRPFSAVGLPAITRWLE